MIAAIVAPAGFLSIAMTRACFVWCPTVRLDDAGAGRLRDTGLAVFRAVGRLMELGFVQPIDGNPAAGLKVKAVRQKTGIDDDPRIAAAR